jgi:type IV pilus assembly protein PilC
MVNFTRVLALLLKSGTKIVEALTITKNTFSNLVYVRIIGNAADEIKKGGQLGVYLATKRRFFPPLVSGMVRIGESTGNLEENLEYLAGYYDEEVDTKLHSLTSLIEPLMLLFMGLLVGFVALSIITPIYSIGQGIK